MINKELQKFTINNQNYEIGQFSALKNFDLFMQCNEVFGHTLSDVLSSIDIDSKNINMSKIGNAASQVLLALHKNDSNHNLIFDILSQTLRNGKAINRSNFDSYYTDNLDEFVAVLIKSMIRHFSGFFSINRIFGHLGIQLEEDQKETDSVL